MFCYNMMPVNFFTITVVFLVGLSLNDCYPTPLQWPAACEGKSYCILKKPPVGFPEDIFATLLKGIKAELVQGGSISNRSGEVEDVAGCSYMKHFDKVYLIRDENDTIRYVAQNKDAFSVKIEVEECSAPGLTTSSKLDEDTQQEMQVYCYETRIPLKLPVLSLDGTKLESVAPKGDLPVTCSAKIIRSNKINKK